MSPSYVPSTIDGSLSPTTPRGEGQTSGEATALSAAATTYRSGVMVFTTGLVGKVLTVTVVRAPAGSVLFDFGDATPPVLVPVLAGGAVLAHTYIYDGTYDVTIESYPTVPNPLAPRDRFSENVAINWPRPFGTP